MATTSARPPRHKPDRVDGQLLNALQAGIPLSRRPFAEIGAAIGLAEDEVLARTARLKEAAIIRQISAIFDTRALGYTSSLVAARYSDDRLFDAAKVINGHPGVSHNYRRTHDFNVWFTVAVEHDSKLGLEGTVDALAEATGAESMRLLPTLQLFKIAVQLDMTGEKKVDDRTAPKAAPVRGDGVLPSEEDRRYVLVLQQDLPIEPAPFDRWAADAGMDPDELIAQGETFIQRRYMRRFAAVLNHRRAGFGANGMAVWRVPEDRLDEVGPRMAAFSAVSHCYRRPTYPDWPFNLFAMVHARSLDACEEAIRALAEDTGLTDPADRAVLYSTLEFKKIRLVYFSPEHREWERRALAGEALPLG
ncbi:MAG: AsnC family transcriptional regulator [Actinomycetota bacterium]